MNRYFISVICIVILSAQGCKPPMVTYKTVPPEIALQDSSKSFLLVDAGNINVPGMMITKKREAVITELSKNYLVLLQDAVEKKLRTKAVIDTTVTIEMVQQIQNKNDAVTESLMRKHNANVIVLVQSYNGGFTQDEVVKATNTDGSTSKTAYYSVYFQTEARIVQGKEWYSKTINASRKHSSRNVVSGLLARGPGYEANKKDLADMMEQNVVKLCELFMTTKQPVYGTLF